MNILTFAHNIRPHAAIIPTRNPRRPFRHLRALWRQAKRRASPFFLALGFVGGWAWHGPQKPALIYVPAFQDFREVAPINRTDLSNQLATPEPEPTPVGLGA